MAGPKPTLECPCEKRFLETQPDFTYTERPKGEAPYKFSGPYRREYLKCRICGHWFSHHDFDLTKLYEGAYVDTSYSEGLRPAFDRVRKLKRGQSDNIERVERIRSFADLHINAGGRVRTLLDVGSGLGVFPAAMKEDGWECTALETEARNVQHAREVVGVRAVRGDLITASPDLGEFDLITFNKVLEHVENATALLRASAQYLQPTGFVYIELPDGERASREGNGREEFFVEHHHVFSSASINLLAKFAGFEVVESKPLREPSTKFTLYAFLRPAAA
jgi:SAM-dependent methyltransferase